MTTVGTAPRTAVRRGVEALSGRRLAWWTLGAYLLARAFSTVLILVATRHQVAVPVWTGPKVSYFTMTQMWDGSWFRQIAEHGYPSRLPVSRNDSVAQNVWAFYPAFPMLARAVMALTGLSFAVIGSSLSLILGAAAAMVMAMLFRDRVGPGAALAAVVVWAVFPASPVLQLAYSESAAVLALCVFVLLLTRERWLGVAGVAVVIGLTRPIGLPVAAVVVVAAWLRWRHRGELPMDNGLWARIGLAVAASIASGWLWPATAWAVTGSATAYTRTEAAWRANHSVRPFGAWYFVADYLFGDWGAPAIMALVCLLALLLAGPWAAVMGTQLRVWCATYAAYLGAAIEPWSGIYRYLVLMFPLALLVVGPRRDGGPTSRRWLVIGGVVLVSLALQVWWVGSLLVFTPLVDLPP